MEMTIGGFIGSLIIHGQKLLVYPSAFEPHPRVVPEPSESDMPFEHVVLQTHDRVTLRCHLILYSQFTNARRGHSQWNEAKSDSSTNQGRATVIMFHGNAMNHGELNHLTFTYVDILACNVLTVSYRGYGNSTGTPSEAGLRIDSQTALDYVTNHEVLSKLPIIVFGLSLGGAVAIDLVSRNPTKVAALIVENTFMSLPSLVKDFPAPIGPLSFLCTQRWPSIDRIRKIPKSVPILMLGGNNDEVVPPKHLQGLWAAATVRGEADTAPKAGFLRSLLCSAPNNSSRSDRETEKSEDLEGHVTMQNGKDRYELLTGGHTDTYLGSGYWFTVMTFINQLDISSNFEPLVT